MLYPVVDISSLNRISRQVLANAAHAMAGMVRARLAPDSNALPCLGLSMFGVTTPCVQGVTQALQGEFECLVFHATGSGGQSLEKLADDGHLAAMVDLTTTEIADLLCGGVLSAGEDRMGAATRRELPYVGSCGALDMINFWARATVPDSSFWWPQADAALFDTIERHTEQGPRRRVLRVPAHINDERFISAVVAAVREVTVRAGVSG